MPIEDIVEALKVVGATNVMLLEEKIPMANVIKEASIISHQAVLLHLDKVSGYQRCSGHQEVNNRDCFRLIFLFRIVNFMLQH